MDAAGGTAAEGVWGLGQADLAMENLLGHGETRTKEGRERGQEWIMKRFCRIE